jgi:hypothetical protein
VSWGVALAGAGSGCVVAGFPPGGTAGPGNEGCGLDASIARRAA